MTDPANTDALRTIAQECHYLYVLNAGERDRVIRLGDALYAAADELDRLRAQNATWQKQWTDTLVAATDWYTETQKLCAVIDNAPHEPPCPARLPATFNRPMPCTCWKADAK